tara:strand:- start:3940 stop:4299 length:360 start_codon:yes stop_codon:yes gene_type:complete
MKYSDVQNLDHGLYRIWWKDGGSSLASVGSDQHGFRWLAPTNWISGSSTSTVCWDAVDHITPIWDRDTDINDIFNFKGAVPSEPEWFDWSQSEFWEDPDNTIPQALIDLMRRKAAWDNS